MSNIVRIGQTKTTTDFSAGYLAYFPMFQAAADSDNAQLTDRSGKGNNGVRNSGMTAAEAWSTVASRFSSIAAANKHGYLAKTILSAAWRWNATYRDTLIISTKAKLTLTAGAQSWIGNANGTGEGGIKAAVDASGQINFGFYDKPNVVAVGHTAIAVEGSGWASDHTITLFMDGPNNSFSIYVDGVNKLRDAALTTVTVLEPQSSSFDWIIGSNQLAAVGTAGSFFDYHMLVAAQSYGRFTDMDALARRLHQSPGPVRKSEFLL